MADNDVKGQLDAIIRFLRTPTWQPFLEDAAVTVVTMQELGLDRDASDMGIWQTCQDQQVVLFTGNRKKEGPESLEQAVRAFQQPDSLPVITLSDPIRFGHERPFAEKAAIKLLDYLLEIDRYRGAGRLWVP
jgi:hypothetical protein